MLVLGIESSCDDLSIAVVESGRVLSNVTASQTRDHAPFGGVVPEIASRRHLESLEATLEKSLQTAGVQLHELEGIAATYAPGLVGSLLVGLNFAKSLAFALKRPFRGVHHIEGHLWSAFIEHEARFPILALAVSGGHTHLFHISEFGSYRLLGHTVDDAAGEAFDKVAKRLGLPFPGGPAIEALARQGNPRAFEFAVPQVKGHPLHTSFSGMKTAALEYLSKTQDLVAADLAAGFQYGVVRALCAMLRRALAQFPAMQLAVAGGVACNGPLREALAELAAEHGIELVLPAPKYCTDNGAMIAFTGERYLSQGLSSPLQLNAQARQSLGNECVGA
ncbi:MAG TPA: tRNA (adenosine(37)-N6)-threonylcarbamoyltransferase complex transferase subunit TsaD [Deltaproteobacteria bacterium]|nr:tRNA (adenosine(37)-N6)-threonylcarbamoyltransferase complex transferase subunit TsaD [Deltaproteobacteria bacterium]